MKRCLIGLLLLAGLPLLALGMEQAGSRAPGEISVLLSRAVREPDGAAALTGRARAVWEDSRGLQKWIRPGEELRGVEEQFLRLEAAQREGQPCLGLLLSLKLRMDRMAGQQALRCPRPVPGWPGPAALRQAGPPGGCFRHHPPQ